MVQRNIRYNGCRDRGRNHASLRLVIPMSCCCVKVARGIFAHKANPFLLIAKLPALRKSADNKSPKSSKSRPSHLCGLYRHHESRHGTAGSWEHLLKGSLVFKYISFFLLHREPLADIRSINIVKNGIETLS